MKTLYIFTIISLFNLSAFCQNIDENGRTAAQQKTTSVATSTPEVYLSEKETAKTATSFTLEYSLPEGKTTGEIMLFHPKADQLLKKVSLTQRQGTIQFSTKDLPTTGVVAGLYADNIFLKSKSIKLLF